MKLSIALLAAPAVAFAPQAQQAASVKLEAHKEVAAATLAAGALLAPFAAFAGDIESGETLFAGNCAACHAGGQNVIMPEKTLEKAVCCAAANCTLAARWTAWACRAARFSRQGLWGLRG